MSEYEHPKLNGRFHALLTWLVIVSGLVLGIIFFELITFSSIGERYTKCDGELHEAMYHQQELSQHCINELTKE